MMRYLLLLLLLAGCTAIDYSCHDCSVLLITMDAARADHLSVYGYERNTSPFIDEFASKSILFDNAISTSALTAFSLPSILTGIYPDKTAAKVHFGTSILARSKIKDITKMQDLIAYPSMVLYSNPMIKITESDSGFMHVISLEGDSTMDDTLLREAAEQFMADDAPFFVWIHFLSPHAPYDPPPQYLIFQGNDTEIDAYDGEIKFIDEEIGKIFEYLEENNLSNNTLVVISSDHGESFGEHALYGDHGELYDTNLRVPLIIHNPHSRITGRRKGVVSLVDLMPSILDILGKDVPKNIDGISLKDYIESGFQLPRKVYSFVPNNISFTHWIVSSRTDFFKVIDHPDHKELYLLWIDPNETDDLMSR